MLISQSNDRSLSEIFGLSNYASWEVRHRWELWRHYYTNFAQVAEVVGICKTKGYVLPKIYQGWVGSFIVLILEGELSQDVQCNHEEYRTRDDTLPPQLWHQTCHLQPFSVCWCLRSHHLYIWIYFSGGFFAGKVQKPDQPPPGRFGGDSMMAKMYRARYFNEGYFKALESLKSIAEKHNLRLTEIGLRWCQHHSLLTPSDGIILGASSNEQLKQNCEDRYGLCMNSSCMRILNRCIARRDHYRRWCSMH